MRTMVAALACLCAAVPAGAQGPSSTAAKEVAPAAEIAWARNHAVPVGIDHEPMTPTERQAILRLVGGARVIGFGEFTHGAHQPLAARNRWIRLLVEQGAITAVALESGLAQSRRVNDYILGGPGDAAEVTRTGFTWTFERYPANLALVRWLRGWNAAHPKRTIRLYGADVTGGDEKDGLGRAAVVIDEVSGFLAKAAPIESAELRVRLRPFAGRFDETAWRKMTPAERDRMRALVVDLGRFYDRRRTLLIARSSPRAYAWSRLMTEDIGRLIPMFDIWPEGEQRDHIPEMLKIVALRDRAMADYVLWALRQEGPKGRLLSFAANGHVTRRGFRYPEFSMSSDGTGPMGEHLATALGRGYRVVLAASSGKPGEASSVGALDDVLIRARTTPYLLDLKGSSPWWRSSRDAGFGIRNRLGVVPAEAADALLFVGPVSDEPLLGAKL